MSRERTLLQIRPRRDGCKWRGLPKRFGNWHTRRTMHLKAVRYWPDWGRPIGHCTC